MTSRCNTSNNLSKMQVLAALLLAFASGTYSDRSSQAKDRKFVSPDILVLGDSQLSFGSGELMLDFFKNFDNHCKGHVKNRQTLARVSKMRTTMMGTRSTSLQSWVSTKGTAWKRMCKKDPTWGVNSSIWGHNSTPKRLYYQIGEGKKYQFCKKGQTPIQAMLKSNYYTPELVFFYLIGNGSKRLAESKAAAVQDVKALVSQLPRTTKCVFMTTTPIHTPRRNRLRVKAEAHLKEAFDEHGMRCSFVSALKPQAVSAIQSKAKYFRRRKSGKVKDPFHPNAAATKVFLDLNKSDVCTAVAAELAPMIVSAVPTQKRPVSPREPRNKIKVPKHKSLPIVIEQLNSREPVVLRGTVSSIAKKMRDQRRAYIRSIGRRAR